MIDLRLPDGNTMPILGYGTYKITPDQDPKRCVLDALEVGYRHIDTAILYNNETQIGQAFAECGLKRSELFVTSKLWVDTRTEEAVRKSVLGMLERLRTDYLDLLLIHWPTPDNVTTWQAMQKLREEGLVRSIGVSNFLPHHIDDLLNAGLAVPAVNQVELHPLFQQVELRRYCAQHGTVVEAWSPLMRGVAVDDQALQSIAEKYGKSAAQVIIRYDIQNGISVLPKTVNKARMRENFDVFDFELSADDMAAIAALDTDKRQYRNPDHHGWCEQ